MKAHEGDAVLLLHGLWMNHFVMSPLAAGLKQAGYLPSLLDYRSMRGTVAEHLQQIEQRMTALPGSRVHLIGHSMGGVLALAWLARQSAQVRIGRTVLLGAPVRKCQAAQDFSQSAVGRWMLGESIELWREPPALAIPPGRDVGAIAGTHAFGLGPLFVHLDGRNDGVVQVEETRIPGLADHIELPVSHTGMLFSADVVQMCVAFLQRGRFHS